jgi:hypothetical protein
MFSELLESVAVKKQTQKGWTFIASAMVQSLCLMAAVLIPHIYATSTAQNTDECFRPRTRSLSAPRARAAGYRSESQAANRFSRAQYFERTDLHRAGHRDESRAATSRNFHGFAGRRPRRLRSPRKQIVELTGPNSAASASAPASTTQSDRAPAHQERRNSPSGEAHPSAAAHLSSSGAADRSSGRRRATCGDRLRRQGQRTAGHLRPSFARTGSAERSQTVALSAHDAQR